MEAAYASIPAARVVQEITDAYGCRGDLDDVAGIEAAIRRGCAAVQAHVLSVTAHRFEPIGSTVFALLAESHVTVTTWPEHGYAVVDVFLCNESMDPGVVLASVLEHLSPTSTRAGRVVHHIQPETEALSP